MNDRYTRRGMLKVTAGAVALAATPWAALGAPDPENVEYRTLGKTGLRVSLLGYGGLKAGQTSPERLAKALNGALDHGLNLIDTAHCYTDSEAAIGAAIGHRRKDYFIATKIGHENGAYGGEWTGSRESILRTLETSCRRMKTDHVDIALIHTCPADWIARDRMMESLEAARERGLTRFVGFSGDNEDALRAMTEHTLDVVELTINALDQRAIDLLMPVARKRNIGVLVKRAVANAIWEYREKPDWPYIQEYWRRMNLLQYPFLTGESRRDTGPDGPAGTMLRFAAGVKGVGSLIVGTSTPGRWTSNNALLQAGPLDAERLARIRARWAEVSTDEWTSH